MESNSKSVLTIKQCCFYLLSVDQIKNVVVVEQLLSSTDLNPQYGQLYGVITKLDLDADNVEQFFRKKW